MNATLYTLSPEDYTYREFLNFLNQWPMDAKPCYDYSNFYPGSWQAFVPHDSPAETAFILRFPLAHRGATISYSK